MSITAEAAHVPSIEMAMRVGDPVKANVFLANALKVIARGRMLTDRLAAASYASESPSDVNAHAIIERRVAAAAKHLPRGVRIAAALEARRSMITIDARFFEEAVRNLHGECFDAQRRRRRHPRRSGTRVSRRRSARHGPRHARRGAPPGVRSFLHDRRRRSAAWRRPLSDEGCRAPRGRHRVDRKHGGAGHDRHTRDSAHSHLSRRAARDAWHIDCDCEAAMDLRGHGRRANKET